MPRAGGGGVRSDIPAGPYGEGALPNLIVAGYSKCGTSSLHRYLDRHPEIAMSRTKEIGFFCDRADPAVVAAMPQGDRAHVNSGRGTWRKGLSWYRTHFDPSAEWRGESTPAYAIPWYSDAPSRIASIVPRARIALCVRDPVERALSRYRFQKLRGLERRTDPAAIAHRDGFYVRASRYSPAWELLALALGPERIHIVETEGLGSSPGETMDRLFDWLGLGGGFGDAEFTRRWNESSAFATPAHRAVERLRRVRGWGHVAERLPVRFRHRWQRALGWGRAGEPQSEQLRERFSELLAPDAERFRGLTGCSFPQWQI